MVKLDKLVSLEKEVKALKRRVRKLESLFLELRASTITMRIEKNPMDFSGGE